MRINIYVPDEIRDILAAAQADAKSQRQGLGWVLLQAWARLRGRRKPKSEPKPEATP